MALNQAIFGEEGKVTFKSPNTTLNFDATDVDTGADTITFDKTHLFVTGHKVQLTEDASGTLPTGLSAATDYYVIKVSSTAISLATSEADALAGTAISITGAGTGTDHIVTLQEYDAMASVTSWSLSPSKAVVDVTTLSSTYRSFKGGLIQMTGSLTAQYEAGDTLADEKARKIFDALLLPYDDGDGSVELYISSTDVSDADRKIVAPVIFTDFQMGNQIGQVITFTVNFQLNGEPTFSGITD